MSPPPPQYCCPMGQVRGGLFFFARRYRDLLLGRGPLGRPARRTSLRELPLSLFKLSPYSRRVSHTFIYISWCSLARSPGRKTEREGAEVKLVRGEEVKEVTKKKHRTESTPCTAAGFTECEGLRQS